MPPDQDFNSIYNRVSSRANYLLVANGVILASIISAYWQCENIPFIDDNSAFIFMVSLFCLFLSSGFCLGAFNPGIYTLIGTDREGEDYKRREGQAILAYQAALFFFGLGLIGIFSRFIELTFHRFWALIYLILFISYMVLVSQFGMFGRFGLSPYAWIASLPQSAPHWQKSTWGVIAIEIFTVSIALIALPQTPSDNPLILYIIGSVLVISALCLQLIVTLNEYWKKTCMLEATDTTAN